MENMRKCAELLYKIRNTSSTNAKQELLEYGMKQHYDETLKKVLNYTFDPFKMFGLTDATLDKTKPQMMKYTIPGEKEVFDLLDLLGTSNINDNLRGMAKSLLMSIEDELVRELVQMIMVKNLNIGVGATTINKVCKDLIPKFDVQLAESLSKQKDGALEGKEIWVTTKLDGFRIVFDSAKQEFRTRQGQLYEGLDHLLEEANKLASLLGNGEDFILDGELIHKPVEGMNSGELYSLTSKVARKKGKTKEKSNLQFNVFDCLPRSEFISGKSKSKYKERRNKLNTVFSLNSFDNMVLVEVLYHGRFDADIVNELLKEVEKNGGEGLMINLNEVYQCKRVKSLLKVKTFHMADVLVLDVLEGEGNFKGLMGGVEVMFLHNGNQKRCFCGSGFYQDERVLYFEKPELLIGKIIEIAYFEVSKNSKTGEESLRFPTYQHRVRDDKTAEDVTDVAITD